jgi:hypothetical protein
VLAGGVVAGVIEHNLVGRTDGNGLLTSLEAAPIVRHNVFVENGVAGPPPRGRGICWLSTPPATIQHNLFFANEIAALLWPAGGAPSNFSGAAANGVSASDGVFGNLDGDPLLSDPDGFDFHLQPGSPAIDAGDPAQPLDPDGTIADLGPFWFDQGDPTGAPEVPSAAAVTGLAGAPNPFRAATTVRFRLPAAARATVDVFDVAGRRVRRLADGPREAGVHEEVWDGRDAAGRPAAGGVYLVVIRAEGEARSAPLVLLR